MLSLVENNQIVDQELLQVPLTMATTMAVATLGN